MPRIKIALPESFPFATELAVRITDINYGGHLGNDALLSLVHEARVQFLQHLGYTELSFEGVALIMTDAGIEYKQEVFYGERLKAYVAADDISRMGFDLCYRLVKVLETGETPVAYAKTGMVCYNYSARKVAALPEAARVKLMNGNGGRN
ncbi:MAG TPA: thioesterase family protein [Chitinophagaceae bacterium]|jgi:acyl-CoA thioesterase FadM|nr:thioesterase family protein [Chitinophagaceae bacterium]